MRHGGNFSGFLTKKFKKETSRYKKCVIIVIYGIPGSQLQEGCQHGASFFGGMTERWCCGGKAGKAQPGRK